MNLLCGRLNSAGGDKPPCVPSEPRRSWSALGGDNKNWVGRCRSTLIASTLGMIDLRLSQVYRASGSSRSIVALEPQSLHDESGGRMISCAFPVSSWRKVINSATQMPRGMGSTYCKRSDMFYILDLRISDQMTLLTVHRVQPWTG